MPDQKTPSSQKPEPAPEQWKLRLYIANQAPRSLRALANLKRLCDEYLSGHYSIEVIDLIEQPERASRDQVIAIPTLVRTHPHPTRKIIGDLSDKEQVLLGLGLALI